MDEVSPSNEGKDLGGGSGGADDLSAVAMAAAAGLSWRPRQLAFSPYYTVNKVQALRVVVRRPKLLRLYAKGFVTKELSIFIVDELKNFAANIFLKLMC